MQINWLALVDIRELQTVFGRERAPMAPFTSCTANSWFTRPRIGKRFALVFRREEKA